MSTLTAVERSIRARAAAYAQHAQGKTNTKPASAAAIARFEREVDPDGVLPPEERARRATWALKSYMAALSLKASRAKVAKRRARTEPQAAKDKVADPTSRSVGSAKADGDHGNGRSAT